ncbi:MAG: hypothetical protein J3K34DRAFT_429311 [Monoraphidium minutum]|nr:MAG: hypothetical protein J3K34DRAFT_429311 [Monoraphidium minutum]
MARAADAAAGAVLRTLLCATAASGGSAAAISDRAFCRSWRRRWLNRCGALRAAAARLRAAARHACAATHDRRPTAALGCATLRSLARCWGAAAALFALAGSGRGG